MKSSKVKKFRTDYIRLGKVCVYETKSESPMHGLLRSRYIARTCELVMDPSVEWPFGVYTEIVREIKSEGYDEAMRRHAAEQSRKRAAEREARRQARNKQY